MQALDSENLRDLDAAVGEATRLDYIGGFVVAHFYGLGRPTADVDVIESAPNEAAERITATGQSRLVAQVCGSRLDQALKGPHPRRRDHPFQPGSESRG
jgi:hypothetical protein